MRIKVHIPEVTVVAKWYPCHRISWLPWKDKVEGRQCGKRYRIYFWLKFMIELVTKYE